MNEAKFVGDPEHIVKNKEPDLDSPPWEDEKYYWISGVIHCFSNVISICKMDKIKEKDNWEIPVEKITNLLYLGSGAQGVVFSAQLDGKKVAVKQLRTKHETNIKHLLKLNHPNLVRFYGACTTSPNFSVIMEFCQYGPLFNYLHSNALFIPNQLLKWAKDIAVGMEYLHAHKIIHRDLKTPNILISQDLMVKVSDFGTSREWNNVSEVMSFTGTVAWMAPEMIRHVLCSERVDVWSYGVVLWELLTAEVPYKNLETHAIMWGVGTHSISLPIPSNFPSSLQVLLKQCWTKVPSDRPPFKIIAAQLEIAGHELRSMNMETFKNTQTRWRAEINESMEQQYSKSTETFNLGSTEVAALRRENLKEARDYRNGYKQKLFQANELFLEMCAMRLQLEQREKIVAEKEKALRECRCGLRSRKLFQRQTSSLSDGMEMPEYHRKKKIEPKAQVIVQFDEKRSDTKTTTLIDHAIFPDQNRPFQNNNFPKDTVIEIEDNGNDFDFLNDNYISAAQV